MRIRLPVELKDRWMQIVEDHGWSQQVAIERLVEWFIQQDGRLRMAIINRGAEEEQRFLLRGALQELAMAARKRAVSPGAKTYPTVPPHKEK